MANFVWNVESAEHVRSHMDEIMLSQSENMQVRAKALLDLANSAEKEAARLESTLPIGEYEYTLVSEEVTDDKGNVISEAEYDREWVTDHEAEGEVRRQIAELRAAVEDARKKARGLSQSAYDLDRERREKNALFYELHQLTQDIDNSCAARIAQIKEGIVYHTNKIIDLKNSLGMVGSHQSQYSCIGSMLATSDTFAAQWGWVNSTLAKQAGDIDRAEFGKLAWWFTKQTNYQGQERFLNAFLEPVHLTARSERSGDATHFTICPEKIEGVQRYLEYGIGLQLISQRNFARGSDEYEFLQYESDFLKGLSALLTVINNLTDHDRGITLFTFDGSPTSKRVITAVGDGPVITLAPNASGGNTITVGLGTVHPSEAGSFFVIPNQASGWRNQHAERSTINISNVLCGFRLHDRNLSNTTSFFHFQHQFDLGGYLVREGTNLMVSLATLGAEATASAVIGIVTSGVGIPEARREAERVQENFMTQYGLLRDGQFQRDFDLRGVIVEHEGLPPAIHSWGTIYTQAALDALNGLDALSELPDFTWQDFLENPREIFRVYSEVLDYNQRAEIYQQLRAYQSNRYFEFRQQSQEEVSLNESQNNSDSHGNMHNPEHDTGDSIHHH